MNNKTKTRSLRVAIIAIALLLCFALAVGVTSALYQARRQATGTLNMDKGIVIDYKGFNKGDENIWQRETTTSFKLFEETNAQPGQEISVYPSGIRANVDSINFYARLKLEYIFYNVANGVETKVDLPNPKSLIKTSNDFFASNWVPSTDGYYYFGENTTLNQFSKDNQNFENLFADGAKFIIEGANFEGETAGEGGGFVVNGTAINKIVVYLTLETLQGDATAEQAKDLGWVIATLNEQIVDITNIPNEKPEINIDDIISDDKKDGEITISGDPKQKLTITIGSKAFYGCSKLKLTLSNSENIEYRIATDAFSTGATIMYGIDNVSSKLINPSTTGHTTVGFEGKWQVSAPGLYLFLPSPITPTTSSYGDFQYTDDQGTWYFDLIDESGNKVDASTLSSIMSTNSVSTLGASTYANTDNYIAKLNKFEPKDGVTTVVIPKYLGVSEDSNKFAVTTLSVTFNECMLLTSIVIPNSVISIGKAAFQHCARLVSIIIPNSVTGIDDEAFWGCQHLTSITIPNSVKYIGSQTFVGCNDLISITVESGNSIYHSASNCLIETASKTLIAGCKTSVIPTDGGVTTIGNSAFYSCDGLTSIIIPDSVTSIGSRAFEDCTGLTSITIPDSVTSIGSRAFFYCSGITSVTIGKGVTSIEISAFYSCDGLTSMHIGAGIQEVSWLPENVSKIAVTISKDNPYLATDSKAIFAKSNGKLSVSKFISADTTYDIPSVVDGLSVTSIGDYAFYSCSNLTSITIPECVTSIRDYAFEGCSGLTSVTIGNGVTSIGNYAFSKCSGLTSITIPNSVTRIGNDAFYACSGLISLAIGDNVTSIGNYAFCGCSSLTSVTIPVGVISIGSGTFKGCSNLTSIIIPNNVTEIEYEAFSGCGSLTSITIPNSVISIEMYAFKGCTGLTNIVLPEGIKSITYSCFSGCSSLESITIPSTCIMIDNRAFENCTNLTTVIWNITYDLGGVNAIGPELSTFNTNTTGGLTITEILKSAPSNIEDGFTFVGWTDGATIYQPGDSYTFNLSNRKLTAVWELIVSFDRNGGEGETIESVKVTKGKGYQTINFPDLTGTREGYKFLGWSLDKDATSARYTSGTYNIEITKSQTFYAIWQAYNTFTFNANGGEGNDVSVTETSSLSSFYVNSYVNSSTFTRSGYYVLGFSTNPNATTADITLSSYIYFSDYNGDQTFYAIWQAYRKFTFNANGGEGEDVSVTETSSLNGFSVNSYINSSTFTRSGYYVLGFSTNPNATTADITLSSYIYFYDYNGDQTFYAIWKENPTTGDTNLKFDLNGGEGKITFEGIYSSDDDVILPEITGVTKEGYKFTGWKYRYSGRDQFGQPGTRLSVGYNFDPSYPIVAQWRELVTITLIFNDGVNDDVVLREIDGVTEINFETYSAKVVAPEGKYFYSWKTASGYYGGTTSISYFANGTTFTAYFKNYETFTLNPNGGDGDSVTFTRSKTNNILDLSKYQITRDGYVLLGWNTDPDSTRIDYKYNEIIEGNVGYPEDDENVILYAVWEKLSNEFTTGYTNVKFDLNGGTGKLTFEGAYREGDTFKLPGIDGVTKEGYTFLGWSTSSDSTTPSYYPGNNRDFYNETYYAIWSKTITISFDLNGGEGILPDPVQTAYNTKIVFNTGKDFTKVGYKFAGWQLVDGNGNDCGTYNAETNQTFYNNGENYTFKAMWSEPQTITFYNDDTKSQSFTMTGFFDVDGIIFPEGSELTKEGYILVGWNTSANSSYVNYSIGQKYSNFSGYTELYAVWKSESEVAKIIFDFSEVEGQENIIKIGYDSSFGISDVVGSIIENIRNASGQAIAGWTWTQGSSNVDEYNDNWIYFSNYQGQTKTLYPVWKNVLTINFDLNGGEGTLPESFEVWERKSFDIPEVSLTKDGYIFAGWAWRSNSAYTDYRNGETNRTFYESDTYGSTTLYAIWKQPLTISFDANGGEGEVPKDIITYAEGRIDIPKVTLTRDGYVFLGWSFNKNPIWDGIEYSNGEDDSGYYQFISKTLYAVWGNTVTYIFDLNGGTGTVPGSISAAYNASISVPSSNGFERAGYKFKGWSINPNSSNYEWSSGSSYAYGISGTITMYAVWEVLTDQVYVGSLTQAELDAVQALWNGHTKRSELTNDSLLNSMSNNKLHSRFSILGYLNNTSLEYGTNGDSYYGIGYGTRYFKLSTNSYTFEFENSLPTGWKLVNWRYEVKASGDVTIVNGRAKATIDYTYAGFENSLSEERLMIIFVLPNQPAEDKSVSVSISGLPGNALEASLKGSGSDTLQYLLMSGIKVEIYDAEGNLLWLGKPNENNNGFVPYRFATGTYKIRFYTTNVNGVAFVNNDNGTEVTGMNISEITKGDGYSEFTITYTYEVGNPNLAIVFKMADVSDLTKLERMDVSSNFCGPYNIVGNWFKGMVANMGVAFTDMTADEIKYAGYCGMLIQEYFKGSICKIPSFGIYTENGKIIENSENIVLELGVEYTIKFAEEVKEVMLLGNDSMSVNSITSITYNETTGTWDATFSVSESTMLMFLTADLDFSQYEDLPAYDANTDYSQYLEMR